MSKNVLIIDDETDFTEITGTLLGFHDFEITTLNNPLIVEENLEKKTYDVIISDLMMPGLNGFELVERIRSHPKNKNTPVVILSAKTLGDEERKKLLLLDVHFVPKPFEPQALVDKVGLLAEKN